ncbi:hypothetical protein [Dysgonomonas alginatilytica]|nr:hypothetical protein [Dysgonomonas alginatilytica]
MITNAFTYKDTTKGFVESLFKEDYDASIEYLVAEDYRNAGISTDSLKSILSTFRQYTVDRFGTDLNYSFLTSRKTISTIESENTPPGMTEVTIQISNQKDFGVFKVLFVDDTHKISKIDILNIKEPIPSMLGFWFLGVLVICIPIFNIYVIIKIKRSSLKKKWIKYIAVILLNAPTIVYSAVNGFSLKLLTFQFLFGIGFNFSGYINCYWSFGIPLGGLFWLWRLYVRAKLKEEGIDLDSDDKQPISSDSESYPSYNQNRKTPESE